MHFIIFHESWKSEFLQLISSIHLLPNTLHPCPEFSSPLCEIPDTFFKTHLLVIKKIGVVLPQKRSLIE